MTLAFFFFRLCWVLVLLKRISSRVSVKFKGSDQQVFPVYFKYLKMSTIVSFVFRPPSEINSSKTMARFRTFSFWIISKVSRNQRKPDPSGRKRKRKADRFHVLSLLRRLSQLGINWSQGVSRWQSNFIPWI